MDELKNPNAKIISAGRVKEESQNQMVRVTFLPFAL